MSAFHERRRDGGFTLLELLIALIIAGLAAAFAARGLGAAPGPALADTARQLGGDLRLARAEAMAQGRPVALTVDMAGRRWQVDRHPARLFDPHVEVRLRGAAREMTDGGGRIRFEPDGSSTGGRITLSRGRRTLVVGVDWLTGRVAVDEP